MVRQGGDRRDQVVAIAVHRLPLTHQEGGSPTKFLTTTGEASFESGPTPHAWVSDEDFVTLVAGPFAQAEFADILDSISVR